MDNNIFNEIGTTLDLNGPILSLSEQPTGATGIGTGAGGTLGASVSFTGVATAVVGSSGTGGTAGTFITCDECKGSRYNLNYSNRWQIKGPYRSS